MGNFKASVTSHDIVINDFRFAAAEADKLKELVGIAGKMGGLKALPPEITNPPFEIRFYENGSMDLLRSNNNDSINFSFDTVDELVKTVTESIKMNNDARTLNPQPRGTGSIDLPFEDIV